MAIQAQLADGRVLEFPDGTDPEVIQSTVKRLIAPPAPSTDRTGGDVVKDIAASAATGIGGLLSFPGQIVKLIPGLQQAGEALETPGEYLTKFGEDLKSAGLKAREALRSQALSEAEKEGVLSQFATAITSTIKDPALLSSFFVEQLPLLLGPAGAAKVAQKIGARGIEAAGAGLTGRAAEEAMAAATQRVGRQATGAAIGTGAAMQAGDISSDTYTAAYQRALQQGMSPDEANSEALNAARLAGAGAAGISALTGFGLGKLFPSTAAIERRMAGLPGAGRLPSVVGEASSESLEEAGGQIFRNVGIRTIDPTQSLTEGVGAAAGLGALGGGFFGGLLGKKPPAELAPGQLPGETLYQTAERLNKQIADIDDAFKTVETTQKPRYLSSAEIVDMYRTQGYGAVKQYQNTLETERQDQSLTKEERKAANEQARDVQDFLSQVTLEEAQRTAQSFTQNLLGDREIHLGMGIPRSDPIYKTLLNKDLGKPEDADAVVTALEGALQRKGLRLTQYERFATALENINQYLSTIPGSGFYAQPSVEPTGREGAGVAGVAGERPAAKRVDQVEQPRVVRPTEVVGEPPRGEAAEPAALAPEAPAAEVVSLTAEKAKRKAYDQESQLLLKELQDLAKEGRVTLEEVNDLNAKIAAAGDGFSAAREIFQLVKEARKRPAATIAKPKVTTQPVAEAANVSAALPKELAGAKPRYAYGPKQFQLEFASDIDKALFITAQKTPSKRDADYRSWLQTQGFTPEQISTQGAAVRQNIKEMAAVSEPKQGPLKIKPVKRSLKAEDRTAEVLRVLEGLEKSKTEEKAAEVLKEAEKSDKQLLTEQRAELIKQLDGILKRILAKYGLKDVKLDLKEAFDSEGSYQRQLITLALNVDSPVRVLRHESIHALKDMGFFTPEQWRVLQKRAKDEWIGNLKNIKHSDTQSRYDAYVEIFNQEAKDKGLTGDEAAKYVEEAVIEESIADAFGVYEETKAPPGLMNAILNRMNKLFKAIKEAFNIAGIESAEDIFGKIEKGQLKPILKPTEEVVSPEEAQPAKPSLRKWYEDGTPRQQDELDNLPAINDFNGMEFIPVTGLVDSANSTYEDFEIAPQVREVPLQPEFVDTNERLYGTKKEQEYISSLAQRISDNQKIEPLIVALEPDGETWILEGQHRVRALSQLGFKSFPARVVVSMEGDRKDYELPLLKREEPKTDYKKAEGQLPLFSLRSSEENAWQATEEDREEAQTMYEEDQFLPYISQGFLDLPVEPPKLSLQKYDPDKHLAFDSTLGVPINKNGTVTVYFHTTKQNALDINNNKVIPANGRNRIYLTNESSGAEAIRTPGNFDQEIDGSVVLVYVTPDMLQVDQSYPDGRVDFFVPLAQGDFFNKKMKWHAVQKRRTEAITEEFSYDKHEKRIKKAFDQYQNADAGQRKDLVKKARDLLKQQHNVGSLLSENGKLEKTRIGEYNLDYDGLPVASQGLGMASAQKITDKLSTCPRSAICEGLCLGETSGGNFLFGAGAAEGVGELEKSAFRAGPRMIQYLKTEALIVNPEAFAIVLQSEIDALKKWSESTTQYKRDPETRKRLTIEKEVYRPAVRLNVTSDFKPEMFSSIINGNPDVMFYDYTKIGSDSIAPNHHLTYSSTGFGQIVNGKKVFFKNKAGSYDHNWATMRSRLNDGQNVAMAFSSKSALPKFLIDEETGVQYNVLDGDLYDARFLDIYTQEKKDAESRGVIVGLRNKAGNISEKNATEKTEGFFVNYDPKVDKDSVTIPDQQQFKQKQIPVKKLSLRAPDIKEFKEWFKKSKVVTGRDTGPVSGGAVMNWLGILPSEQSSYWKGLDNSERERLTEEYRNRDGEPGKPKLMYHATGRDITKFRPKQANAIFVSPSPDFAASYGDASISWMLSNFETLVSPEDVKAAEQDAIGAVKKQYKRNKKHVEFLIEQIKSGTPVGEAADFLLTAREKYLKSGRNIIPLYVSAQKPFDPDNDAHIEELKQVSTYAIDEDELRSGSWRYIESPRIQELIKEAGFDGFYVYEGGVKNLAVYSPDQVKSAIGNIGAYGQRPVTAEEAERLGMTEEEAQAAQAEGDIRLSLRSQTAWTDERIKNLLRSYAYTQSSREGDAKAYAARITPRDFLNATADTEAEKRILKETKPLSPEELAKEDQPIYLEISKEGDGDYQIVNHEGRHRMMALANAGYDRGVPVVLVNRPYGAVQNAEPIEEAYLRRQLFGDRTGRKGINVQLMVPISWKYRQELREQFGGEAEVKFSLRSLVSNAMTPSVTKTVNKIAPPTYNPNLWERILNAVSGDSFTKIRTEIINRYERLASYDRAVAKQIKQAGGVQQLADQRAESAALFSDLGAGLLETAMGANDKFGGVPVFRNGITVIDNFNRTIKGPILIVKPLADLKDPEVFRLWQVWKSVQRGKRLDVEGRENLIDKADIQTIERMERQNKNLIKIFKMVDKDWTAYNDKLVQYMVDTGVISKAMAQQWTKHGDYFPFYRLMDLNDVQGPKMFSSLANVRPPKKLKGGEEPLGDFFENIVRNSQAAIQAGIKNVAAQVATQQALKLQQVVRLPKAQSGANVYRVMENGKEVYYESADPLFVDAIKSLNMPDLPFIGILSGPANILRNLVTKDPAFMLANMMRDSMAAWVTSGVKMTPIIDTARNFALAIANKSPETQRLYAAGVLGGYDYARGVKTSAEDFRKRLRALSNTKTPTEKLLTPFTSLWGALEKGTQASDAATRAEVYKRVLAETGSEAEAYWQALEIMNFNRRGRSPVIRVLTAAIPFLNARMQGLDLLFRTAIYPVGGGSTDQAIQRMKTFWVRGMTLMALSGMYWLLTHDDDEYKKQEKEVRDEYWLIPSLGIKLPIPFEIGIMFKVIPERIAELTFGSDTNKDFTQAMKRQFVNTFGIGGPQVAKPLIEVSTNHNFYTDRPIIGKGLEDVAAPYQVGPSTSRVAEAIGKAVGYSPMKVDHLIKGYTGTMGTYAVDLFDMIFDMTDRPQKASKRFEQMPVIKRFALDPEARGTVTAYYEFKDRVDEIVRTTNLLQRSMNYEEYGKYMQDNLQTLAFKGYVNSLERTMKDYREMKAVVMSSQMDPDQKRDTLTSIGRMESALTRNIQTIKKVAE